MIWRRRRNKSANRGEATLDLTTTYLQTIQRVCPELQVVSAHLNTQGQNNVILIVNEQVVFRFPKYFHLIEHLKVEAEILRFIQTCLPLPIPKPEFVHLEVQTVGEAFLGYTMIPGEPLGRDRFQTIEDEGILDGLAQQLTGFLQALHHLPVDPAFKRNLPIYETRQEYQEMFERVQKRLFVFMRLDARQWATNHFQTFLSETNNFTIPPVLRHGDFGTSNLLFDPGSQRITGVIDFSSTGLGDPAVDFSGLLSSYGEAFLMRCMRFCPDLEGMLPRVRFYRGVFALEEALFGIENDDPEAFQAGIAQYV